MQYNSENQWLTLCRRHGACQAGQVTLKALELSERRFKAVQRRQPGTTALVMAAFPYLTDDEPGYIARFARGADYHTVVTNRLKTILTEMRRCLPGLEGAVCVDDSPVPEVKAARLSGVGKTGRHGLCICPPYGSYVSLGGILLTSELPDWLCSDAGYCDGCGECRRACPTGALGDTFQRERCLSHITQTRVLTPEQENLLRQHPRHWGCDACQEGCPENRDVPLTPLRDFDAAVTRLYTPGMTLTNRSYGWRGQEVLRRNADLSRDSEMSRDTKTKQE